MSRAYRIRVSETLRQHVRVSDGVRTHLELIGVLPPEAMAGLLAAELGARGFARQGEHMVRVEDDGAEIRVGVSGEDMGQVTVGLRRDAELDISVHRSRRVYEEQAEHEQSALEAEVKRTLERRREQEEARLTAEVTRVLERKLHDLGAELDRISHRVTAEALKTRAAQLGEIEEISEDPDTGSLTIRVKV